MKIDTFEEFFRSALENRFRWGSIYDFIVLFNEDYKKQFNNSMISYYRNADVYKEMQEYNDIYNSVEIESFLAFMREKDIVKPMFVKRKHDVPSQISIYGCMLPCTQDVQYFTNREPELEYLRIMLLREIKNNVLIIGEAGVGKTTLVNYYAHITNQPIFSISMASLLSNTSYRGSFETKMSEVIEYAKKNKLILFIDEMHVLLNAGNSEGGISAANILKPYITDPDIKIIGATTYGDLQLVLHDRALTRRFNFLYLKPFSKEECRKIYDKVSNRFELYGMDEHYDFIYDKLTESVPLKQNNDLIVDFIDFYSAYKKYYKTSSINEAIDIFTKFNEHQLCDKEI